MRLWYLSHRRPAKAQASLRIRAVSPEPSLFTHMKYGRRLRFWRKIRHLAPLDGSTCAFEEWVYGGRKVPKSHEMAQWLIFFLVVDDMVSLLAAWVRLQMRKPWSAWVGFLFEVLSFHSIYFICLTHNEWNNLEGLKAHFKLKRIMTCVYLVLLCLHKMSLVTRKPVFVVFDQIRHKPACAAKEAR